MPSTSPGTVNPGMGSTYESDSIYPLTERFKGKSKSSKKEIERMVAWTKQTFLEIKTARTSIERRWMLNMCFYDGRQHVMFRNTNNIIQGTMGQLVVPPAPYWRARPVINRIRPIIRTELSKLTSQKPSAYIIPNSSEEHDIFAAQAGEQIWESVYRNYKLKRTIRKAVWWMAICGTSFIKTCWEPDAPVADAEPAIDPTTGELSLPSGDFKYFHETPFHIFVPDLREEEIEAQPYLIHAQLRSADWAAVKFPELKLAPSDKTEEILPNSFLSLMGSNNVRGQQGVLVYEVWIKPQSLPQYPNGGMFTVIGDSIVQATEGWPYGHGEYPFAKLDHIPSGKFYSDSSIIDLIPLQKEYNRTRGQIIEAKNRMSKPQILAEKGSVESSKITTEPGQVIYYQPGYEKPTPIPLVNLPNYVTQELDRILADIEDISGQHEVSNGTAPPGVTAATAINYLQEQDDSKLAPTYESIEEAVEKVAKQTLNLIQEFWDVPRIIKITGVDRTFDTLSFKGSDLKNNTDIRVEAGSALPTSKAAKQAFIMDLMKMGFISPDKGLEVMEIGGAEKLYEEVQLDVRAAQRENLKMAAVDPQMYEMHMQEQQAKLMQAQMQPEIGPDGQPIPPAIENIVPTHTWDNHALHIQTHNNYRKSQAFEQLDDTQKQVFEQHVNEHKAAMFADMMEQMQFQQGQNLAEIGGDTSGNVSDSSGTTTTPPPNNPGSPVAEGI